MYQHILFPVEFDLKGNYFAIQKINELMEFYKAKVSLVHVVELPTIDIFPDTQNKEMSYVDLARKRLAEIGKKLNIPIADQYVEIGEPKVIIPELMKKLKIDLCVVGHHERHGIYHPLGSTAYALLSHANCDVLVIPYSKY